MRRFNMSNCSIHKNKEAFRFVLLAFCFLFVMTGCRTSTIPVEVTIPGDFNISGVSKIAIVDFNTIQDDSKAGLFSADRPTVSLVQNMVTSAFTQSRMYQIANLDIEKIAVENNPDAKLENRFDAILYGRLWWQVSPEVLQAYPQVFNLESWRNVSYTEYNSKGESYTEHKELTTRKKDELATMYYRAKKASLMLSLSLYRIDTEGLLEKVADTFIIASQGFIVDNGEFGTQFLDYDISDKNDRVARMKEASEEKESFFDSLVSTKKEAGAGQKKVEIVKNTAAIPTDLQFKLMLAETLSKELSKKFSPSKIELNVVNKFSDDKLFNLLKDKAFNAAEDHIVYYIRNKAGNAIADKIDPLQAYTVPPYLTPAKDPETTDPDKFNKLVKKAANKNIDYLYALAICEEAQGKYEQALDTYRYIFNLDPEKDYANGISRCLFALGMNERVQELEKARKSAGKEANLE